MNSKIKAVNLIAHNGQGFKQLGYALPSPRAYCRSTKDTKADDIFYRPAELGRPEAEAGICTADEKIYSVAPQLLEADVSCSHLPSNPLLFFQRKVITADAHKSNEGNNN